jgi:hypothetical protein
LAKIADKQKDPETAARYYAEAIRLGFGGPEVLYRLVKISFSCEEKGSIIKIIKGRLAHLKKERRGRFKKEESKFVSLVERYLS